ncbi:MAG TPA: hypothetical protein VH206_14830 [Xanthobacteraceae bacterium]|jgi:hypothetical protein|nr:hypothetical protein [Xanthobacteraceae bacterium]
MKIASNLVVRLLMAAALTGLFTGIAAAQFMPSISLGGHDRPKLSPEEQEKQDALDKAYKSATTKIPDQKTNDPWATVRQAPAAPAPKKKPSAQ